MSESKYYQIKDIYPRLKHPEKYVGKRPITCRSSWESKLILKYIDINSNILRWDSEGWVIPYTCGTDGKQHRYFIDFWFEAKTKDGSTQEFLVEVKPYAETIPPEKPKRVTKSFQYKIRSWIKNQSKWKATRELCESAQQKGKKISFMILTEKDCPFFLK